MLKFHLMLGNIKSSSIFATSNNNNDMIIKKCVRCKIPKSFEDDFYFIGKSKTMVYGICKVCIDDDIHQQIVNQQIVANNLNLENMSKESTIENVNIKCNCCGIEKSVYAFNYMIAEKKFLDKCNDCIPQNDRHIELNQSNYNQWLRRPLSDNVLSGDALDAFGLKYLEYMLTTKKKLRLNDNFLDSDVKKRCQYLLDAGYKFDASTITVTTPSNKIVKGNYNGKKGITFRMYDEKGKSKQVGVNLIDFIYYINLVKFNSLKSAKMENSNNAAQGAKTDAVVSNVQSATTVDKIEAIQLKIAKMVSELTTLSSELSELKKEAIPPAPTHSSYVDFATANEIALDDFTTPIIEMQLKTITLPNDLQEVDGVTLYPIAVMKKTFNIN